jgi:hypothetical protein
MKLEEVDWQKFEQRVEEIRTSVGQKVASRIIFRGQGNSEWLLDTALERKGHKNMSLIDYYRLISSVGPAISTFTGVQTPAYDQNLEKIFTDANLHFGRITPSGPIYEYMAYLRHHGFPSPLLDWTRSPYVAAFFAFRDANSESKKRSIYAYVEGPTGAKGGMHGMPRIWALGPYVRTHRRHFLQQSVYTVCVSLNDNKHWQYDSHQKVFENPGPEQEDLWKFDIHFTERDKILNLLDKFNLNSFSLFGSDEALFETLWLREKGLS